MDDLPRRLGDTDTASASRDEITWLLGQPRLQDYLRFVEEMVVGGGNPQELCDEWRTANDYYHDLEQGEAGIADQVECRELDPALARLAQEVTATPRSRHTFATLPTRFGMVELERLVVCQPHVTRRFIDSLKSRLGPAPALEDVFRICLPVGHRDPPAQIRRAGSRRYVFSSESTDLRFHESVLLGAEQIRDYAAVGPIAGVLGLAVGFSSNLLSVISADKRLLLLNGYHRACALRELGITHAPCLIRTVTRRDELEIVADRTVCQAPAFYFKAARPPLLKDFFDPKVRKVLPVYRTRKMIEVSFEVREFEVPE
jgi:hypothetical protein